MPILATFPCGGCSPQDSLDHAGGVVEPHRRGAKFGMLCQAVPTDSRSVPNEQEAQPATSSHRSHATHALGTPAQIGTRDQRLVSGRLGFLLLSWPANMERYWAFACLGSNMPANVCLWYQKAGLGA